MIALKMKGRDSLLSIFSSPWGDQTLGHVRILTGRSLSHLVPTFKTWNDAVFATKELFEKDKRLISINDYEPWEV
jgi:hypothetical protein